jgi:DNA-binding transcriptional MerR regulator
MTALPPKLYFRIGEVASLVGVEPHVLRYWEREFRSIRPTKSAKGQRVYSRRDVENLMRVRQLLYGEGFTIAGAKKKLQRTGLEPEPVVAADLDDDREPETEAEPAVAAVTSALTSVAAGVSVALASRAGTGEAARMRATLLELRSEIESLLSELG